MGVVVVLVTRILRPLVVRVDMPVDITGEHEEVLIMVPELGVVVLPGVPGLPVVIMLMVLMLAIIPVEEAGVEVWSPEPLEPVVLVDQD